MKRVLVAMMILLVAFAVTVYAGPLDWLKGGLANVGWEAVALGLSALLAVGGIAKYTPIISAGFLFVGTIFATVSIVAEILAGVFNWIGAAFEDGKLDAGEIKQTPKIWDDGAASIRATLKTVATAWAALKKVKSSA